MKELLNGSHYHLSLPIESVIVIALLIYYHDEVIDVIRMLILLVVKLLGI
jgi:hypothetical protein